MNNFCMTCEGSRFVEEEHDDQCYAANECICELAGLHPGLNPCPDCTPEAATAGDSK